MKKTALIFLRHAETQKDPARNAALWDLSEKGKAQAVALAHNPALCTADIIYTSEEPKTRLTVEPMVARYHIPIHRSPYFNEVTRGDTFFTKDQFEREKTLQLTDLSYRAFGGESGVEALERFKKGAAEVSARHEGQTTLIVTHGTIMNIYFGDLLNAQNELLERWSKTNFCAYGIVENGKVVKDIIAS